MNIHVATMGGMIMSVVGMEILTNRAPLEYPLYLKPGLSTDVIRTIGDASKFLMTFRTKLAGRLHWTAACANLEIADRHQGHSGVLRMATLSMENALRADKMLRI